jgi:hypothetical protein
VLEVIEEIRFGADELMLYTPIVDGKDRAHSYQLIMLAGG